MQGKSPPKERSKKDDLVIERDQVKINKAQLMHKSVPRRNLGCYLGQIFKAARSGAGR